ncbi:hypothetical protein C8F01DRAFT_501047 [Mycena amicta]|nr:hypothetical protein C8F01DRAFT_501047 [Mycena amicta]
MTCLRPGNSASQQPLTAVLVPCQLAQIWLPLLESCNRPYAQQQPEEEPAESPRNSSRVSQKTTTKQRGYSATRSQKAYHQLGRQQLPDEPTNHCWRPRSGMRPFPTGNNATTGEWLLNSCPPAAACVQITCRRASSSITHQRRQSFPFIHWFLSGRPEPFKEAEPPDGVEIREYANMSLFSVANFKFALPQSRPYVAASPTSFNRSSLATAH